MDLLCAELGAHSAIVQGLVLEGPRAATFWMAHDSRTNLAPYQASISDSGNPRLDRKRLHSSVGRLVRDEDLFDGDEWPIQQRLQQQLSALGYGRFLGGLISVGPGYYMALALHREVGDNGDFSDREKDRIAALLPHFAQALQLTQSVACSRSAEALLRGLLERWKCGLIVCDADGHVLWRNEQALMSLTCGGGLRLRNGMLYAATAESQQRLELALRRQVGRNAPGFVVLDAGGRRWQLAVQELQPATVGSAEPLLLIALTGDQPAGVISAESLVSLFELTDAESRLTSALVAGSTLEEYAVRRGVELSTVRYQLKQVLAKTGTRRQVDLVRRVLCSAAAYVVGSREQIVRCR
ncbi:helix-turn-helix transcriptional regulator [Bradyrhizobium betae]|nr:helix-turn-helix transcriptional regulator [Bradyrhizobium betae]